MEFDTIFTVPEVEASETAAQKKRKRDKRLEVFEMLREASHDRIRFMEEEIYEELESRFKKHRRLGDIDVDSLLRAGAASTSATVSAPTSHRAPNFKPNEAFLGSKPFPWWRISDTVAKTEDIDAVSDFLLTGGTFTDIE